MRGAKTTVRIGDKAREVTLERRGERLTARVDGREYSLSIREPQHGVYSFVPADGGGRSTEVIVHESDGTFRVRIRGRYFDASVARPGRGDWLLGGAVEGRKVLRSVMPGRVVRILVAAGAAVRRGQGVVVVEAMKMENELGAPREGIVVELLVAPGDRVEAGAPLAVIE